MRELAQALMPHLMVAPVLLPLLTACLLMLVSERRHRTKATLGLLATAANLVVAVLLVFWVKAEDEPSAFGIYLPSNWDVPYGIVLVLDRLSALMLVMTALVALMALLFSLARWHKAGAHFHPLFQIQIMGLNGAFLTGDLFNLFVFFEVMLAASYGLLLHGSGPARVKAGLHYIAINLAASSLFLVGAALIYGVTGTLNMADLAARLPEVADADRALLHAGCAILGVAFLAKAAMWPLNFWLVPAYASASAPSAAVFALLTKVGVYVLLRLSTLLFSDGAGDSAGFGSAWLLWGGLATLALGAIGMMSAQRPARLAGFAVIVSSGTLMAVFGLARPEVTAGALYYLPGVHLRGGGVFPADRTHGPLAAIGGHAPAGAGRRRRPPAVFHGRAGVVARRQPRRRRGAAGGPRHSRRHRAAGPGLHRLHAAAGGSAAVLGFHRQVRHALHAAGRARWHRGAGELVAHGRHHRLGSAGLAGAVAHRHPLLLDAGGPPGPGVARGGVPADRLADRRCVCCSPCAPKR